MPIKYFEDLEIWKESRHLTRTVYRLTDDSRFAKDFSLKEQIRRASVSTMSNIAEGFERGGNQEFIQFLYIGRARAAKCAPNSVWRSIKNMSGKGRPMS